MALIGSKHGRAKLTEDDVEIIKALLAERDRLLTEAGKITAQSIAEKFGIHEGTVRRIHAGRNWSHVA